MWAVYVDDILICFCATEGDAYSIALAQPYGCDVSVCFIDD